MKPVFICFNLLHLFLRPNFTIRYFRMSTLKMNTLILITVALAITFLLINVDTVCFTVYSVFALSLICVKIAKYFKKLDKTDDIIISSPPIHQNDQEKVRDCLIEVKAKNKCFSLFHYFESSAPRWLINCTVLPVLMNIEPRARDSWLLRWATFFKVRPEDIGQFNFYELAEAGFWYDESSSSVCCCRCTSQFELEKFPEDKDTWHVPRCHFHVPAQVEHVTSRTEVDESRNRQNLQETTSRSEDMNTMEQTGPPAPGSRSAEVVATGQLIQPTGLGQQPTRPAPDPSKAYKTFEARENSITGKDWAVEPNTPRALAMNGLYYGGMGDRLCCISCPFLITGWYEVGRLVDVKNEHAKSSPLCGAIRHRPSPP